jgi:chemotaxis regulatin CheY-phosphate phosphatase CheZ
MARAISEGDFNRQFQRHFPGELGRLAAYIDELRQNLKALSPAIGTSAHLIPQATQGVAEISQHAQSGVNSILELVEEMLADQEQAANLLDQLSQGQPSDLPQLQSITRRNRGSLISLMSYLSFEDVVRQRAEKVQQMIGEVEKKIVELLTKFKIKLKEHESEEGNGQEILREEVKELSQDMGLDQTLVDELLESLG